MINECRLSSKELTENTVAVEHAAFVLSRARSGLTLIELLVTIVIMVTVLGGVLPLVSPNNNSRKIREASRQLNSLMAQAQSQAARDGRPVGVAFRESGTTAPHSGIALEAFLIAEPPAFAGFSEHSRIVVRSVGLTYGTGGGSANQGTRFLPAMEGKPVCQLELYASGAVDSFPPRTLKIGDTVTVGGNTFLICDDADQTDMPNKVELLNDNEYLVSDPTVPSPTPGTVLQGIWLNYHGQVLPQIPTPPVGQAYEINRQPVNAPNPALQFPRGVGVDLLASGATIFDSTGRFDEVLPLHTPPPPPKVTPVVVGVMFSPNGALESLYVDGVRNDSVSQVYFLMGLLENGNSDVMDPADYDFSGGTASIDNDQLAQRRTRINWLNGDSRWVTLNRAGRIITADNNISFDPRMIEYSDSITGTPQEQNAERVRRQLDGHTTGGNSVPGARANAKAMIASGGN